jgi:putative tricarboxylic transport membrane protein
MDQAHDTSTAERSSIRGSCSALALRLIMPVACLAGGLVLPSMVLDAGRTVRARGLGPTAWPDFMLTLIAALSVVWIIQEVIAWRRGLGKQVAAGPVDTAEADYDYRKALIGMGLVVGYGWALPLVGFSVATAVFIAAICLLGGLRRALVIGPVSIFGTAGLLWVFMGLALMPLDRGEGAFGRFSLAVLRGLGIY